MALDLKNGFARLDPGYLRGECLDGEVRVFRGIPYAAPPVGGLRWKPPQPVPTWFGIRNATAFAGECVQGGANEMPADIDEHPAFSHPAFLAHATSRSEDCLYLNVWTPAKSAGERLPVFVWIHGGGYQGGGGSNFLYNSAPIAEKDIVAVTINYRCGLFGFLAHPWLTEESGLGASGSYGLLDQIAALKWVKEHIAAFGGDPNKVTVGGQSAGSGSVGALVASPLAAGLFRGAVMQSGAPYGLLDVRKPRSEAERFGITFAHMCGAHSLGELREIGAWELQKKSVQSNFLFWPCVDGLVLSKPTGEIIDSGAHNRCAVLCGGNTHEWAAQYNPEKGLDQAKYFELLKREYPEHWEELLKRYPAGTPRETALSAIRMGGEGMIIAGRRMASMARKYQNDAYAYRFSRTIPSPDTEFYGASHSCELPSLFRLEGFGSINPWDAREWTRTDRDYSALVISYWTNFVKNLDPNGEGLPHWPLYDDKDFMGMDFGDEPHPAPLPAAGHYGFSLETLGIKNA